MSGTRESSSLKLPLREVLEHAVDAPFGRTICLYWGHKGDSEKPTWIDFEIFEAIGREVPGQRGIAISSCPDGDGVPLYYSTEDRELTAGVTTDLGRAVWTAHGFVKFDGCTQVYFPTGPVHYDDREGLRGLFVAICRAQERCYEIMEHE